MVDITVIVPVYNVKKYLRECMESLAVQKGLNCEFICIDDGSTDGSYTVIEKYVDKDKRFKLIRQENKGPAETRNVGIRNAQGKYITFLDADDYWADNNVLETLYRKAQENKLDIISFETELVYEDSMKKTNNKDFYYYKKHRYEGARKGRWFFVEMMLNHEYCDSACLLCVKREWLLKEGILFYPNILYEDALFCMHCFLRAEKMIHLSERLYTYRVREKSITTTQSHWDNVRSRLVVYREILQMLFQIRNDEAQLQNCVADYLSLVAAHVKWLDEFRIDEPPDDLSEPLDDLLMKSLELGKYRRIVNEHIILSGIEKIVSESQGIILYGAGEVGELLYRFLDDRGLCPKILCYAVSTLSTTQSNINGIPILPIFEASKKQGLIIVSVVNHKAQQDMQEILIQLGIEQFELCDQYIYRALRHYVQTIVE